MINRYTALLIFLTINAAGQTPALVKDINTGSPISSSPFGNSVDLISGGSYLLFNSIAGEDGDELWRTDLTTGGTYMLKNLYTEYNTSRTPSTFTTHNGNTYFITGDYHFDLWKTDGTPGGTTRIKTFTSTSYRIYKMYSLTTGLWFIFENGNNIEIWKSDGTTAGTVNIKTITDGANYIDQNHFKSVKYNNKIYFNMGDNTAGIEPWVSDGTSAGTFMLRNIAGGSTSSIFWYGDNNNSSYPKYSNFIVYNNQVLFTCKVGNAVQIWKSDGTTAGTLLFFNPPAGVIIDDCSAQIAAANGYVFFIGTSFSIFGTELCLTDGTSANTFYFDNTPGSSGMWTPFSGERIMGANGNYIFWDYDNGGNLLSANASSTTDLGVPPPYAFYDFTIGNNKYAVNSSGGLLKTDGTTSGTVILNPGGQIQYVSAACVHNGEVFMVAGNNNNYNIWKSNGTTGGTLIQNSFNSSLVQANQSSYPDQMIQAGNTVYFTADNGSQGTELWKTDGSTGGTTLVKDIYSGSAGSFPEALYSWNGELYFSANNNTNGTELWKSDGSTGGTVMVKDIFSGSDDSYPANFVSYNGFLYFSAYSSTGNCELWKTDGTNSGTVQVKDFNASGSGLQTYNTGILGTYNGQLLIAANNGINGAELWISDGTTGGTTLLKDINPGSNSSEISGGITFNGLYYFAASNGSTGVELWVTDGTTNGTQPVKDINNGSSDSDPYGFFLFGNKFYFTAYTNGNGRELWVSDGTAGGTNQLADASSGTGNTPPAHITLNGSYFFFFAEDGSELWKSDGSIGGTSFIGNVCTNPCYSYSYQTTPVLYNGQLYFQSNGDVYSCDGNSINLVNALNLAPGAKTHPTAMAGTNLGLLVALDNQVDGNECWLFNGSTASLLGNLAPHAMGSYVQQFVPYNNSVLMVAYSITTDFELYKIDNITVTSGIDEISDNGMASADQLEAFPVPANDHVTWRFKQKGLQAERIEIVDLQGRLNAMITTKTESAPSIDIHLLQPGIYILKVTDQYRHVHTVKILKSVN